MHDFRLGLIWLFFFVFSCDLKNKNATTRQFKPELDPYSNVLLLYIRRDGLFLSNFLEKFTSLACLGWEVER